MALTKITDHESRAVSLLLTQFRGKPRLESLLKAFVGELQELENAIWDLYTLRGLDTATGAQLDGVGSIVGQARIGSLQPDDEYRAYIYMKISKNVSKGEPERMIQLLKLLTASSFVETREYSPAHVILTFDGDLPFTGGEAFLNDFMDETAAAGVSTSLIMADPDEPFAFDGSALGEGWGDSTDPAIGGKFSAVI